MKHFSIQESLSFGWNTFKKNPWVLILITLTITVIPSLSQYILQLPFQPQTENSSYNPLMLIGTIISTLLSIYLTIGVIKVYLKLADGKKVAYQDVFDVKADEFVNYIAASILYGLIVLAGTILLIIPGIYLGIRYQYYNYLIIDKHEGIVDSLKRSSKVTEGNIWRLFLLSLTLILVSLLGLLALVVGVLVASPVVGLAQTYVYRKLSGAKKD